jgi:hypothetical protein
MGGSVLESAEVPELLEVLFEQIGADGLQVVSEQIAETVLLFSDKVPLSA